MSRGLLAPTIPCPLSEDAPANAPLGRRRLRLKDAAVELVVLFFVLLDVLGRRILVHEEPRVVDGRGEYARVVTYRPGQLLPLVLDGLEVAAVPFDALLR